MNQIVLTVLVFIAVAADRSSGGRPRVYNALISTNQELLPSRAYPAVSPVIGQPLYLTTSLEIHHEQTEDIEAQQPYSEAAYEYQGQEIEDANYDAYDDQQYQGFEGEVEDVRGSASQNSRSNGHLSQQLRQESSRVTQEVSRHAVRPPALQNNKKPFILPTHHHNPPKDQPWDESTSPTYNRPTQRPRSNVPGRKPQVPPAPNLSKPGQPPLPSQFFTLGGIPFNNQPADIPVVPPPPIPVRVKPA